MKTAIIFGGSGFVGRNLVSKLLKHHFRVKVVTRDKEQASHLKTFAGPEFLSLQELNYHHFSKLDELLGDILKGGHVVINLVGLLAEEKRGDFAHYHSKFADILSKKCQTLGVEHFVHLSALKIEKATKSKYAKSKLKAENFILENFPKATILRPSIIFGKEDNFFNKF